MRGNLGTYILVTLIILLVFGVISFVDILSVFLYIVLGVVALLVIGGLIFRYKINKMRKEAQNAGGEGAYRSYTWRSGRPNPTGYSRKEEGEVTIKGVDAANKKVVNKDVGDYVEYEEVNEENDK